MWWIDFNPSLGGETQKVRSAIIVSNNSSNKTFPGKIAVVCVTVVRVEKRFVNIDAYA